MKNQLFITVWVVTIAVAVFFGLSSITVSQTQHQKQIQSQIQAQHNSQITIVDTSKRYTNVSWVITNFHLNRTSDEIVALEKFVKNWYDNPDSTNVLFWMELQSQYGRLIPKEVWTDTPNF